MCDMSWGDCCPSYSNYGQGSSQVDPTYINNNTIGDNYNNTTYNPIPDFPTIDTSINPISLGCTQTVGDIYGSSSGVYDPLTGLNIPNSTGLSSFFQTLQKAAPAAASLGLGYLAMQCQQAINNLVQKQYNDYKNSVAAIKSGYGVTCGPQSNQYNVNGVPLSTALQMPNTRNVDQIVKMPTNYGGTTSVNTNAGNVPTLPAKAAHGGLMSTRVRYATGSIVNMPGAPAQGSFLNDPNYQQRQANLLNQVKSNPQLGALLKQRLMQARQNAISTGFRGGAQLNPLSQNLAHGGRAHYDSGGLTDLIQQQLENPIYQYQFQKNLQNEITDDQQKYSGMNGLSSLPQNLLDSLKLSMGAQGLKTGGIPTGNLRQNQHGIHEIDYRKKGGYVPPIGVKEKADDIPAMLSNNEFVFTADAVRKAGGGDVKEGARRMYALMKHLEGK